ncbi:hypothetical protein NX059_003122 [Plenodomus lindquistii]|nr:hypothetical protein NX059_003122 [Plenodomus lindquistii]
MLTASRRQPFTMQDLRQSQDQAHFSHDSNGQPREGYLNLTRRMENEEEDQFDCDLTILDFLVYKATGLVFEWRSSSDPFHSDLPSALVSMTADWRTFLAHKHSGRHLTPKASFRSRLLQFALIFTHRLHHTETWTTPSSLNSLRQQNTARGDYWRTRTSHPPALPPSFTSSQAFPLSAPELLTHRTNLANTLHIPSDQRPWITDPTPTTPLACLIPLFLELTSARISLGDSWLPTTDYFNLLAELLLQSVVEEYLLLGAHGAEIFESIFAVGYPGERWADDPASVHAMRVVFAESSDSWLAIRAKTISDLSPRTSGESWTQSLTRAQSLHSYMAFEERLLAFLKYLHDGIVKPDLAQVEEGRLNIDGRELSEEESRAALRRMGL